MSAATAAETSSTFTSAVEEGMAEATISMSADEERKSALRDNIERKGNNAYYFAHANPAQGPQWDGKAEPRLLSREGSTMLGERRNFSAFEYHKSNITSYCFLDEGSKVKIYVELPGAKKDKVTLDYTVTSLCLVIADYVAPVVPSATPEDSTEGEPEEAPLPGVERCLSFGNLYGSIQSASFKVKKDRIILTLNKVPKETVDDDDDEDDNDNDDDNGNDENADKMDAEKDDREEEGAEDAPKDEEEAAKKEEEEAKPKEPKLKYVTWTQITSQG